MARLLDLGVDFEHWCFACGRRNPTGLQLDFDVSTDRATARYTGLQRHQGYDGTLHGGVMAGLVDHVLGCVLYPLMQRGQWAATTEFKLNYLAPVRGGTLVAESTVVSFTKRTAVVRVEVTNEEQLVCVAQGTLLVAEPVKKP